MVTSAEQLRTEARPIIDRQPLSALALALWAELKRRSAFSRRAAVKDRVLAESLGTHRRQVCDAACDLLAAGVLVLAGGQGRWIGTVPEAIVYRQRLRRRAVQVFLRGRAVNRGIAQHQRQGALFQDIPLDTGGV